MPNLKTNKKEEKIHKAITKFMKDNINEIVSLDSLTKYVNNKCATHFNNAEMSWKFKSNPSKSRIMSFKHKNRNGKMFFIFKKAKWS